LSVFPKQEIPKPVTSPPKNPSKTMFQPVNEARIQAFPLLAWAIHIFPPLSAFMRHVTVKATAKVTVKVESLDLEVGWWKLPRNEGNQHGTDKREERESHVRIGRDC
jgi:hypothetical protein